MKSFELGRQLGLECVALKVFLFVLLRCIPDPGGRDDAATSGLVCACPQVKASVAFVSEQTLPTGRRICKEFPVRLSYT